MQAISPSPGVTTTRSRINERKPLALVTPNIPSSDATSTNPHPEMSRVHWKPKSATYAKPNHQIATSSSGVITPKEDDMLAGSNTLSVNGNIEHVMRESRGMASLRAVQAIHATGDLS